MLSHEVDPQTRKFKCSHCSKAFKFKHHLKVIRFIRSLSHNHPFLSPPRNTFVFTQVKNPLSALIVANASPIRVPIPLT